METTGIHFNCMITIQVRICLKIFNFSLAWLFLMLFPLSTSHAHFRRLQQPSPLGVSGAYITRDLHTGTLTFSLKALADSQNVLKSLYGWENGI